ncbi:p105 [Rhizobium phage 16-3]|nr:p105 [Rhizobium phage 16-3]ABF71351.1 p105 [Rhizobium phage 16-3]
MRSPNTKDVLARLEVLWRKLEDEGMYVGSNTVALAIEEIKKLASSKS